jgi:hypothetical protein
MAQKWPSVVVLEGASPGSVAEAIPTVVALECGGLYVVLQLGDGRGVRLMLTSKKDSNGGAAHRHTKNVARGGAPVARTQARPRRGEEARWCSGFGDRGAAGSISAMLGRRWPTMVWRGASAVVEMKWLGGECVVALTRSSCGSDELMELHGSRAQHSADAEKSTVLLELGVRAVTRRGSGEEAED